MITFVKCFLYCCTTVSHTSDITWNKEKDNLTLDHARTGCTLKYKESPCLVKLHKVDDETFRATCGPDNVKRVK